MHLTEEGRSDNTKEVFQRIQVGCDQSDHRTTLYASRSGQESGTSCEHAQSLDEGGSTPCCQAFRGNGKLTAEQEETRKLKAQVKRLEMEKDILKKATVFFAAETTCSICVSPSIRMPIPLACSVRFWVSTVAGSTTIGRMRRTNPSIPCTRRCWNGSRISLSTLVIAMALVE